MAFSGTQAIGNFNPNVMPALCPEAAGRLAKVPEYPRVSTEGSKGNPFRVHAGPRHALQASVRETVNCVSPTNQDPYGAWPRVYVFGYSSILQG